MSEILTGSTRKKIKRRVAEDLMKIAAENKVSRRTVYKRLDYGWSLEEAVHTPVMEDCNRMRNTELDYFRRTKSKVFTFTYYDDDLDRLLKCIRSTRKSKAQFFCEAIEFYLDHLETKKNITNKNHE